MGILDFFRGIKSDNTVPVEQPLPKYSKHECSWCNGEGSEKKWQGLYFHKRCKKAYKAEIKRTLNS